LFFFSCWYLRTSPIAESVTPPPCSSRAPKSDSNLKRGQARLLLTSRTKADGSVALPRTARASAHRNAAGRDSAQRCPDQHCDQDQHNSRADEPARMNASFRVLTIMLGRLLLLMLSFFFMVLMMLIFVVHCFSHCREIGSSEPTPSATCGFLGPENGCSFWPWQSTGSIRSLWGIIGFGLFREAAK
jgi:hypothetical protein